MIKSMTGFGSKEIKVVPFGKISVELRSTNHKFLETVIHLPEGFLSLEDRVKKVVESKLKRGRITCVINLSGGPANRVFINQGLLKKYTQELKNIQKLYNLKDRVSLDTLIRLPGVLSLEQNQVDKTFVWLHLKTLLKQALDDLLRMRSKEGSALESSLKNYIQALKIDLKTIKTKFKKVIKAKVASIKSAEERSNFLKDTDITEEIERLAYHLKNFTNKLLEKGPVGKELDFIAQEMQREANTMGAKSCDSLISAKVVQIKAQIEKIREQVQNIE